MGQQFANAARSELVSAIAAGTTTFEIAPALNPYPDANTGPNPVSNDADWFKLVVQDDQGFEIVYCRTHTSGTTTLGDILRGQEGTTAREFAAGSVVGLRMTAADAAKSIVSGYGGIARNTAGDIVLVDENSFPGSDVTRSANARPGAGGDESVAIGADARAAGQSGLAFGYSASAWGPNSMALGPTASAGHDRSTAIGRGATTSKNNQVSFASLNNETHVATTPRLVSGVATPEVSQDAANKAYVDGLLDDHKESDDHDTRYYTKAEVDDAVGAGGAALDDHKSSDDHDSRYYTKAEVDTSLGTRDGALDEHKDSDDHDARYYTKAAVDTELGLRDAALDDHKASDDHDARYYTKAEVDEAVAGASMMGLVTRNWEGNLIVSDDDDFTGAGNTYSANADTGSSGTFNTVIGESASTTSTGSVVVGGGANVTANSGVALGNNTVVTALHSVALGNRSRTYIDGTALPETERVVSVGYGESHASYAKTRRLINVSDPEHPNDSATKAYVDQAVLDAAVSVIINRHSSTHYTMNAADAGALIIVQGASDKAVVVPPAGDVPFPLGTIVYVSQMGAGRVLIVPGQDVTLHTADGLYTPGEHLMVGLTLIGPNEWLVTGAVQ